MCGHQSGTDTVSLLHRKKKWLMCCANKFHSDTIIRLNSAIQDEVTILFMSSVLSDGVFRIQTSPI